MCALQLGVRLSKGLSPADFLEGVDAHAFDWNVLRLEVEPVLLDLLLGELRELQVLLEDEITVVSTPRACLEMALQVENLHLALEGIASEAFMLDPLSKEEDAVNLLHAAHI